MSWAGVFGGSHLLSLCLLLTTPRSAGVSSEMFKRRAARDLDARCLGWNPRLSPLELVNWMDSGGSVIFAVAFLSCCKFSTALEFSASTSSDS